MQIDYAVQCPDCKKATPPKESRLHRNYSDVTVVFCSEGHKYTGAEIETYLESGDSPKIEVKKEEPLLFAPPLPKETTEIVEELETSMKKSFEMTPLPVIPPEAMKAVEQIHKAAEQITGTVPIPAIEPRRIGSKQLPGGALQLTIVIPDPQASYLAGEAEFRQKTVIEHFTEIVMHGLDARWFYLFFAVVVKHFS